MLLTIPYAVVSSKAIIKLSEATLSVPKNIKTMKLYPEAKRIFRELDNLGVQENESIDVQSLFAFDQLHYHGIQSVQACINTLNIKRGDKLLEIGSGWGGPSRYIAHMVGANVEALELQKDYNDVGFSLTERCGLSDRVTHVCTDFLTYENKNNHFNNIVSWLALYHIPNRQKSCLRIFELLKPGGKVFIEDLTVFDQNANINWDLLKNDLFANSLISIDDYKSHFENAGFKIDVCQDMTIDWSKFTRDRYSNFLERKNEFIDLHGKDLFDQMKYFYMKIVEYFNVKAIGGLRLICSK